MCVSVYVCCYDGAEKQQWTEAAGPNTSQQEAGMWGEEVEEELEEQRTIW